LRQQSAMQDSAATSRAMLREADQKRRAMEDAYFSAKNASADHLRKTDELKKIGARGIAIMRAETRFCQNAGRNAWRRQPSPEAPTSGVNQPCPNTDPGPAGETGVSGD
jgi:hypothetical protein